MQAAGNYDRFKELMMLKNEQLHNEAVEMLRRKRGEDPTAPSLAAGGEDEDGEDVVFSQEDINEAIRQSLAHHAAERDAVVAEKRQVDHAVAASVAGLLKSHATADDVPPTYAEVAVPAEERAASGGRKGSAPDPAEIEQRRANLRLQRDKILNQKRKEREQHLQKQESARPKSGRVARAALAGESAPQVDERTIQFRRLLLQKIKEEVEGQPSSAGN